MRSLRTRRAACSVLVLAVAAVAAQSAFGWSGTLYFNDTAAPGTPQYTAGWAYRTGNRMDTGTGYLPVEVWSLTTGFVVTNDQQGAGLIESTYASIYRRQGCWNPGTVPFNYSYSFTCAWQ
jgi:hypothetical protein